MALSKKPPRPIRNKRPNPISLRFSDEGEFHLRILTRALNLTQIEAIEGLLKHEYELKKKEMPEEIRAIENRLKKEK